MSTINIQQLHDETERFVLAAGLEAIQIQVDGRVVAVLGPPSKLASFQDCWNRREQLLSQIRLTGPWDSTAAISADRDRG